MSLFAVIKQFATDVKIAVGVGTTTTLTGTVSWFNWTPNGILQLATLFAMIAGGVLSVVLIIVHYRKNRIECKKIELQISIMRTKEKERQEAVRKERRRVSDLRG